LRKGFGHRLPPPAAVRLAMSVTFDLGAQTLAVRKPEQGVRDHLGVFRIRRSPGDSRSAKIDYGVVGNVVAACLPTCAGRAALDGAWRSALGQIEVEVIQFHARSPPS